MENQTIEKQFNINEIKLIVGLGNVGREYDQTRHNAGFEFLDMFADRNKFTTEDKFKSLLSSRELNGSKIILSKPTTLMNSSGEAVVLLSNYFNIEPENILIVHDDLDLRIGSFKIQFAKGPKIHNGIISIENRMGTNKFWRLRLGVENRDSVSRQQIQGQNYVLSRFKNDELESLRSAFQDITDSWL